MWEVYTLGRMPYERLNNTEIVHEVSGGYRLYRPQMANDKIYSIMTKCWHEVTIGLSLKQPRFMTIKKSKGVGDSYKSFSLISEARRTAHISGSCNGHSGFA